MNFKNLFYLAFLTSALNISYAESKCPGQYNHKTWTNGCYGEYKYDEGNTYKGQFENGEPHGNGSSLMPNGDGYNGSWSKGLPNGNGSYISDNGKTKYIGMFLNGKPHGKGTMINQQGSVYEGNFANGNPIGAGSYKRIVQKSDSISSMRYGSGSSKSKFIKGKWVNNEFIVD